MIIIVSFIVILVFSLHSKGETLRDSCRLVTLVYRSHIDIGDENWKYYQLRQNNVILAVNKVAILRDVLTYILRID